MNVTEKLSQLIQERGWSEYRLAKESNLPHSTILNIFRRKNLPSIVTLDAICKGLGITLSQFFSDDEFESLTKEQREVLLELIDVMFRHFEKQEAKK
mgnify:CR=1 FL=1